VLNRIGGFGGSGVCLVLVSRARAASTYGGAPQPKQLAAPLFALSTCPLLLHASLLCVP